MVEPEKREGAEPHASESADYVGWLVKLDITIPPAWREDSASEGADPANLRGLKDVLRIIKADFRQLTVPLLGRLERVLPSHTYIRLGKIFRRWERLLHEKTGETALCQVRIRLSIASQPELRPERDSDLIDDDITSGLIVNLAGEAITGKVLLGRFHPDHRERTVFDAVEDARRGLEALRRKKVEGDSN